MAMKISSGLFIAENVLVDPFMADLYSEVLPEPARHLLRAPVLADQCFDQNPSRGFDAAPSLLPSVQSKLMCLFGSIASQTPIPTQLPADRRLMNPDKVRNFRLVVSCFQKCRNLISLFTGKLHVDTHTVPVLCRCQCSFDLAGLRSIDATAAYLLFQPVKLHL